MFNTQVKKNKNIKTGKMPKTGHGMMIISNGAGSHKHKNDRRNNDRNVQLAKRIVEY